MNKINTGSILPIDLSVLIDDNPVKATGLITNDGTTMDAADTLTAGSHIYEFVAALTGAAEEVLIEADVDDTLQNLKDLINEGRAAVAASTVLTSNNTNVTAGKVVVLEESAAHTSISGSGTLGGTTLGGSTIGTVDIGGEGGRTSRLTVVAPQLTGTPTYTVGIYDANDNQIYLSGNQTENATTNTALEITVRPDDYIKITTSTKVEETLAFAILIR